VVVCRLVRALSVVRESGGVFWVFARGVFMWEDPIRDAAWRRGAFFVPGGGGETPVVISWV
jgi:hypothetical protein